MYLKPNSPHAASAGKSVIGFNVINGKEVEGDLSLIQSKSPVDSRDLVGMFPDSGEKDVARAAKAASDAFPEWSHTSPAFRQGILDAAASLLEAHAGAVARVATREVGLTRAEALAEVTIAVAALRAQDAEAPRSLDGGLQIRRRPAGVCGVLASGVSPLAAPARKIAPALRHGNTVVWKPSDNAPTSGYLLLRALLGAGLPPGVVNTVNGRGRAGCGRHFLGGVERGQFQAFSFVGSPILGRHVGEVCGRNLLLPDLELAGKGALVVLPGADLSRAAAFALMAGFSGAGQGLTGLTNLLVHEACHGDFRDALLEGLDELPMGNPLAHEAVALGPLMNARSAAAFREHWDTGRAEGARLLRGGEAWTEANRTAHVHGEIAHGIHVQPCLWEGVTADMGRFRHPLAGPALNLCPVHDLPEALASAGSLPRLPFLALFGGAPTDLAACQHLGRADLILWNPAERLSPALPGAFSTGTLPGLRWAVDGLTRWEAAPTDLPVAACLDPTPLVGPATDWDSL